MKCPRCEAENRESLRFCEDCGARLAVTCASCGAEVTPGKRFCGSCGTSLTAASAPEARFASPQAYTPKHLAERILTSKAALEGERKQVTILFADLKGSMELLADRDPEEARKLLDPVLEHMMEAVHRYEGTVNQVMGDGIMALFGAPVAHEDHAIRACYAALRMQETVKRYAEGIFRSYGVPVEIRVGLNSGEVVVRAIGSDLHMDYTAVGQTTHLAARMEQMARPGTILLTPETLALAEGFVQVSSRGPVPVKGLGAPLEIFELTGANPVRSRLHAAAARGLTRFVGRDAELELLRQALGRAGQGQGQVVAIVGEPGVGKSRLVWEFTHSHRSQDWLVLEAASVSYGKATTYFPVIELLRRYFQIEARDDSRKVREKVTGKLLSLDRALEPTLPVFLSLLDVPVENAEWVNLDPPQRRRRMLEALKRLLVRESQIQPVLLVFEDLHWIDSETQALLDTLVESVPTTRLLLLVNYRPEYNHGWGSKTYYQQVRLDTLPTANAGQLLEALLGTDPGLASLQRLLIERTQGNPFFLEETVHALVETGVLRGDRGSYRLAGPLQNLQVPATVQVILAARIDRLAPHDKRLLQAAAAIGKEVPFTLLQAIADEPEEALGQGLLRLQAAEFLYEARLFPDLEYTFKHALTHEVAYSSLLEQQKRALHGRILEAIERSYAERITEHAERLAHHALRAEHWPKALQYLRQAGVRAADRSAHQEAVAYFEQAMIAADRLPETPAVLQQAVDLTIQLRGSLFPIGDSERARTYLARGAEQAARLGDRLRIGRVAAFQGHLFWSLGEPRRAVASAQKAVDIANEFRDLPLRAVGMFFLGQANHSLGRYRDAVEILEALLRLIPEELRYDRFGMQLAGSVAATTWLAMSRAALGDFVEAHETARRGLRIAQEMNQPYSLFHAWLAIGEVACFQGDADPATAALERAIQIGLAAGLPRLANAAAMRLAHSYALAGRLEEAARSSETAVHVAETSGFRSFIAWSLVTLAEVHLAASRPADARQVADEALRRAREYGQRGYEASALRVFGDIEITSVGSCDAAKSAYNQALLIAGELGMRPLVAHCHLGLAKLYQRTGKLQNAQEHLTTATTMYRDMGMTYWLEEAEGQLRELT